jgi:hypothetical protein
VLAMSGTGHLFDLCHSALFGNVIMRATEFVSCGQNCSDFVSANGRNQSLIEALIGQHDCAFERRTLNAIR